MLIQGSVSKVEALPARNADEKGLTSVSIEGISVLLGAEKEVPQEGDIIRANVQVTWRKGKRPIHFLQSWRSVLAAA